MIKNNILNIMNKQQKFSVFNIDKTPNIFLKIMGKLFIEAAAALMQACWQLVYYFKYFCRVKIVALHKVGKDFYISL